nr:prepilin-type N-terminal cleavage/methylation domain-containing protein [Moraxella osloensis]
MKVLNRQYHRDQDRNQGREQGFTLIELVITIAIIAIIAAMAAPNMQRQIRQARIKDGANIIEAALKDARTQAMIAQRSTRVVLTNSSSSKKITVLYVKRSATDADEMLSDYTLDKNLTITASPSALTAVSFTPYKKAYQGDTGTGTATDSSTNFSVCYGAGSDKYTIMVDASSNIVTSKNGTCS